MATFKTLHINPPVLNSSCLWASDLTQLRELYDCPHTGAVTTRTATLHGFREDDSHTVVFTADRLSTLNSYGYSPHPFSQYLEWIHKLLTTNTLLPAWRAPKPIILSITASHAEDLAQMVEQIQRVRADLRALRSQVDAPSPAHALAIELNTSCPNIPAAPPPSYHLPALRPHLVVLAAAVRADPSLAVGVKLPPYPDVTRVRDVVECLAEHTVGEGPDAWCPFAFLTCTNTLGGSVLFAGEADPASLLGSTRAVADPTAFAVPTALGGIGGKRLHALALGTVLSFSRALAAHPSPAVRAIKIIGVGGVKDRASANRMRTAGASAVACATGLGRDGVKVFEKILSDG